MLIIPAIDIKNGKCVRLQQGDYDKVTTYFDDIAQTALLWVNQGATRIHLVDLDGAKDGKTTNMQPIKELISALKTYTKQTNKTIETQLGGGIRNIATMETYLELGINYLILGTAAIKNPSFLKQATAKYADNIIAGLDAKNGMVAIDGWQVVTEFSAVEKAKEFKDLGIKEVIYTDIAKDGMLEGVNISQTLNLATEANISVIASGGVSSLDDIKQLKQANQGLISGVITGKAIYEKRLDLAQAIATAT